MRTIRWSVFRIGFGEIGVRKRKVGNRGWGFDTVSIDGWRWIFWRLWWRDKHVESKLAGVI